MNKIKIAIILLSLVTIFASCGKNKNTKKETIDTKTEEVKEFDFSKENLSQDNIKRELNKSNLEVKLYNNEYGNIILIERKDEDYWNEKSFLRENIIMDMYCIEKLFKNKDIDEIEYIAYFKTLDEYGNKYDLVGFKINITKENYNKINLENIRNENIMKILDLADSYYINEIISNGINNN